MRSLPFLIQEKLKSDIHSKVENCSKLTEVISIITHLGITLIERYKVRLNFRQGRFIQYVLTFGVQSDKFPFWQNVKDVICIECNIHTFAGLVPNV